MPDPAPPVLPDAPVAALTVFRCGRWRDLLGLLWRHGRVKDDVHRHAHGLVAASVGVDLRARTVYSLSLWRDLDAMRTVGFAGSHVDAARRALRGGHIATEHVVYRPAGHWRTVLADARDPQPAPVRAGAPVRAAQTARATRTTTADHTTTPHATPTHKEDRHHA